jgi:hypothetical protein
VLKYRWAIRRNIALIGESKMMDEHEQERRELAYLLEVERLRRRHIRDVVSEVLKHTAKVCREEWTREQVDGYLRDQMAIIPPLPDKRILAGSAEPFDWCALAEQYARILEHQQMRLAKLEQAAKGVLHTVAINQDSDSGYEAMITLRNALNESQP